MSYPEMIPFDTKAKLVKLEAVNAELLEALERSLQYIVVAHYDSENSNELLAMCKRDYEKVTAAIAKARE